MGDAVPFFSSGFFLLRTTSATRKARTTGNPYEYVILMDARTAADFFKDPGALAVDLEKRVRSLVRRWNQENGAASQRGNRVSFRLSLSCQKQRCVLRAKKSHRC